MNDKDKIEMVRRILNNAVNINMNPDIVLKISEKLDQHIIDYYLNYDEMSSRAKNGFCKRTNLGRSTKK
mgnify:CR=1 FL=1